MFASDQCRCMDEECGLDAFEVKQTDVGRGQDTLSRVEACRCMSCDRTWVRYSEEAERSGAWSRWYRVLTDSEPTDELSLEEAAAILAAAPYHFYGGSYYRTPGERALGPVHISPRELPLAA